MPSYKYKARTGRGDLMEGYLDARDSSEAAAQLLNGGLTPIAIESGGSAGSARRVKTGGIGRSSKKPSMQELILFCRQMYTLMRSGVPIVRGMVALIESTANRVLVAILEDIRADIESGRELSSGLSRYPEIFSPLFTNMIRVGENTGRLDEAFLRIGQYLTLEWETRARVKAAMRYPTFVLAAIGAAIIIINIFVIPVFADVFERASVELPLPTQILITVSNFFVEYGTYLLVLAVLAWLSVSHYVKTASGRYKWDKLKLRLPVVGDIINRATLGRFARAFALASRAGVPLIQNLSLVARALDNDYIGDRVLQMRNGVERGDSLARTAAGTGLFSALVLQMIAIGEETGAVDDLLEEVAEFYEREVDADLKNLSSTIEPILICGVGVMVLMLALGVFLPMWDLAAGTGR